MNDTIIGQPSRRMSIYVRALARWALVLILCISAGRKLIDVPGFERVLKSAGFFSSVEATGLSYAVPMGELVVAACLALPRLEFVGATATLLLGAAFAGFHVYLYANGVLVPCGCTGVQNTPPGAAYHLWMGGVCITMVLGAITLLLLVPWKYRQSSSPPAA